MPGAGYSSKCKTCNSARRLEIEARHEEGNSPEEIEVWLKSLGESISYNAIRNHLQAHYNVQEAAREKYHQSQAQIEKDVVGRLTDLQILDDLIQDGHVIHVGLKEQIKELDDKFAVPMPAVQMLNGVAAEICRAIKTKQEILGEDSESRKTDTLLELINAVSDSEESSGS
jgi:NADPH:quinone reductase-like Zn-dependent oxidoreductase